MHSYLICIEAELNLFLNTGSDIKFEMAEIPFNYLGKYYFFLGCMQECSWHHCSVNHMSPRNKNHHAYLFSSTTNLLYAPCFSIV